MGTWYAPQTKQEKKQLLEYRKEAKLLRDKVSAIFGDDIVCDAFDMLDDRLKFAAKGKWTKMDHRTADCRHPAAYGEALGVCSLCRSNVLDDSELVVDIHKTLVPK